MNAQHTPGLWVARKDPDGCRDDWVIGTHDGKIDGVAVCGERDAALIAAAPDLLEALEQAVTSMQDSGYPNSHVAVRAARTAIAKATRTTANARNQRQP